MRGARQVLWLVAAGLLALPGLVQAQPATKAAAPLPADAKPVASKQGDHFRLEVLQVPTAKVGETVRAELRILPRGGYKVNKAYPTRIELTSPLTFSKPKLGKKDAVELTDARARFSLDFVPATAGEATVKAEVRFSVCNKAACDLGRETLTWTVKATP